MTRVNSVPQSHPRALFTADSLAKLRSDASAGSLDEEAAALIQQLRIQADEAVAAPVPQVTLPDDLLVPDGPIWDARYPADTAAFNKHEVMMAPLRQLYGRLPATAFLAALEPGGSYLDYVTAAMGELARIDLAPSSYLNTHQFHGVVPTLSLALDFVWDQLDEPSREAIIRPLVARATEFCEHSLRACFEEPLGSHNIVYGPPEMLVCALALAHHVAEADDWLADVHQFLDAYFPSYGGASGGWGQGFGYVYSHYLIRMAQMLTVASGDDFFDRPWARANGNHLLYFRPPWSTCGSFGDASYAITPELNREIMQAYARIYGDGVYQWYTDWYANEEKDGDVTPARDPLLALSIAVRWPRIPAATSPEHLRPSIHLADTGWVAMHSELAGRDTDIMLCFKSSGFGSFSHSHPDQNSFVLEAFGRPLLIDSGYYPWYGSDHDLAWTRRTRSHNAVLFDGRGQGRWNLAAAGQITAYASGGSLDYCVGDATAAYQHGTVLAMRRDLAVPEDDATDVSVLRAVRHVVFLRPGLFIIVDDVETAEPKPIQLMFHSPERFGEPRADGRIALTNSPAVAAMRFWRTGGSSPKLSFSDQFGVAPERVRGHEFANQWHLTAEFAPDGGMPFVAARQLIVTTISVSGEDDDILDADVELSRSGSAQDWLEVLTVSAGQDRVSLSVSEQGSQLRHRHEGAKAPLLEVSAP